MEIVINLPDEYVARLIALADAMNASPNRCELLPLWTVDSAIMVAAINGIKEMESRYIEQASV